MRTSSIPFSLQVAFFRTYMATLKLAGRVLSLIITFPQVFVGPASSRLLCGAIAGTGIKRVLLVTDAVLVELGFIEPLCRALQDQGIRVTVYDGVQPDPGVAEIEAGLSLLQRNDCDAVLAVGGGSAMDAGKIIAARASNPGKSVEQMTGLFKLRKAPLPIYCIPTTAGTGSEVSVGAVVSDPAESRKLPVIDHKLVARAAALDGALMTRLPAAVTAATAMDALTHAVESYLSRNATAETDELALEAVTLISRYLPRVLADGEDIEARQMMSWAAYRAGLSFTRAGLGYVHAIAHNFGGHYHTPHGWANAIVLPYVLEYSAPACTEKLAALARVCDGLDVDAGSDAEQAQCFIDYVRTLKRQCGIPEQLDALREEHIPAIARAALQEAHFTYAVPRYMDLQTCQDLVRRMLVA